MIRTSPKNYQRWGQFIQDNFKLDEWQQVYQILDEVLSLENKNLWSGTLVLIKNTKQI